jgi:calcineurin-like phosphoesterase family protein
MWRLDELAHTYAHCDVITITGDYTSSSKRQLPAEWNDWPHRVKLAVPGNHDDDDTYDNLTRWGKTSNTPWVYTYGGLCFVGVDTSDGFSSAKKFLYENRYYYRSKGDAVVLLTHIWPYFYMNDELSDAVVEFLGDRLLLVLHGHFHKATFQAEWDPCAKLGNISYYRSHVYSAASARKGLAHLITFTGDEFTCEEIQGQALSPCVRIVVASIDWPMPSL